MDKSYRHAFSAIVTMAREAQTDGAQAFFGIEVSTNTLIAIDAELTRLEAIETAARAYVGHKTRADGMCPTEFSNQEIDAADEVMDLAYDAVLAALEAANE